MNTLVVGTGFLGRVVCNRLVLRGHRPLHTFRSRRYFDDSIQYDLLCQNLEDVVNFSAIDTVVIMSKVEDILDTAQVIDVMGRFFHQCRQKRVIYISSDAVFDGSRGMYRETDCRNPATPYGKHKALCEDMLSECVLDHCILRPSYIFGYSLGQLDDRLNSAKTLVANRQDVRKYVDMFKSPVDVNQLGDLIVKVCESRYRGVLHACGTRMSVYDFFRRSLEALGMDIRYLQADRMPENRASACLVDTSLDSSLLRATFGMEPVSVAQSLESVMVGVGTF